MMILIQRFIKTTAAVAFFSIFLPACSTESLNEPVEIQGKNELKKWLPLGPVVT